MEFQIHYPIKMNLNGTTRRNGVSRAPESERFGCVDEVRILNRSLSPAEIKRDFLDQNESYQLSQMDYDAHSNYTSQVFDLGSSPNITTLRWVEEFPYGDELGQDENSTAVLIMHFEDYVNGTGTNVTDSSGYGNNGTLNGTNCTVEGIMGYGCYFDGSGDFINITNSISVSNLTAEAWVKVASLGGANPQIYIQQLNGVSTGRTLLGVRYDINNNFFTNIGNTALYSGTVPDINRWYHTAVTYDTSDTGNEVKLYVDGVLVASHSETLEEGTTPYLIGRGKTTIQHFNGTVDEVAIWNRSLSASEIRNHYYRGALNLTLQTRTGSYYENSNPRRVLSLHFTPNPTNSSQVLDDSGRGNHGSITGAHFSEGKLGSALVFDGVNDYVAVEVRE